MGRGEDPWQDEERTLERTFRGRPQLTVGFPEAHRPCFLVLSLLVGGLGAGCAGPGERALSPEIRAVSVEAFKDRTGDIFLGPLLREEVRQAVRMDGRVRIAGAGEPAGGRIEGAVVAYDKQPSRFDANNVVQEYRLRLAVDVAFTDTASGAALWPSAPAKVALGVAPAAPAKVGLHEMPSAPAKVGLHEMPAAPAKVGSREAPEKGGALRRFERTTNFVVVPASGLPVETEEDARLRLTRDLAQDIVRRAIEGR